MYHRYKLKKNFAPQDGSFDEWRELKRNDHVLHCKSGNGHRPLKTIFFKMSHHNRQHFTIEIFIFMHFYLLIYLVQCNSTALISFLFFQYKTDFDIDTCHVISFSIPSGTQIWTEVHNHSFSIINIWVQFQVSFDNNETITSSSLTLINDNFYRNRVGWTWLIVRN